MKDFWVDGKKYRIGWERNNMAATDWHPDGWRVYEDAPWLGFDSVWFIRGTKNMPEEELTNQIRYWQKLKAERDKFYADPKNCPAFPRRNDHETD